MDFGASKNDQNAQGLNSLHMCAVFGTPEMLRWLISIGFDPESTMKEGITPLIAAASKGRVDTVFALLRFEDVDVNMHSSNHITALHAASLEGHLEVMDILLDHGATLECPNKDGCTPVFMAAQNNHTKALRWLIKHGADVETQRFDGTTALQIAISEKHTYVARMLIQAGANVNAKGRFTFTAAAIAACTASKQSIKLLDKYGADFGIKVNNITCAQMYKDASRGRDLHADLEAWRVEDRW